MLGLKPIGVTTVTAGPGSVASLPSPYVPAAGTPDTGGGGSTLSYFPANPTGFSLLTGDDVSGSPGTATTLVLGADQELLSVKLAGDAHPRWTMMSDATDGLYLGDGTIDPYQVGVELFVDPQAQGGAFGIANQKNRGSFSPPSATSPWPFLRLEGQVFYETAGDPNGQNFNMSPASIAGTFNAAWCLDFDTPALWVLNGRTTPNWVRIGGLPVYSGTVGVSITDASSTGTAITQNGSGGIRISNNGAGNPGISILDSGSFGVLVSSLGNVTLNGQNLVQLNYTGTATNSGIALNSDSGWVDLGAGASVTIAAGVEVGTGHGIVGGTGGVSISATPGVNTPNPAAGQILVNSAAGMSLTDSSVNGIELLASNGGAFLSLGPFGGTLTGNAGPNQPQVALASNGSVSVQNQHSSIAIDGASGEIVFSAGNVNSSSGIAILNAGVNGIVLSDSSAGGVVLQSFHTGTGIALSSTGGAPISMSATGGGNISIGGTSSFPTLLIEQQSGAAFFYCSTGWSGSVPGTPGYFAVNVGTNIATGTGNIVLAATGSLMVEAADGSGPVMQVATGNKQIGVFGHTPTGRQTVTGSKGGNAALASLLSALAAFGWITDSST